MRTASTAAACGLLETGTLSANPEGRSFIFRTVAQAVWAGHARDARPPGQPVVKRAAAHIPASSAKSAHAAADVLLPSVPAMFALEA
jgi:hypothetical protein